jgi:hypothetical protein
MFAIKEWGYERPTKSLYDTVLEIVEKRYRITKKPVAFEVIVGELGKYRRFINPSSGLMAISLNPALKQISPGRFIPKRFCQDANGEAESKHLDRLLAKFEEECSPSPDE